MGLFHRHFEACRFVVRDWTNNMYPVNIDILKLAQSRPACYTWSLSTGTCFGHRAWSMAEVTLAPNDVHVCASPRFQHTRILGYMHFLKHRYEWRRRRRRGKFPRPPLRLGDRGFLVQQPHRSRREGEGTPFFTLKWKK